MDGIELFEKRVFMRQRESRNSDRDRSNDSRGDRYDYLHDYSSPFIFSYREQRSGSPPLWKTDSPRLDGGRGRRDREVFVTPPQRHRQGGGWNRYEDQYGTPQVSYSKPFDSVLTFFCQEYRGRRQDRGNNYDRSYSAPQNKRNRNGGKWPQYR